MPSRRRLGRHSILAIAWQRRRQPHLQPGHHGRVLHGRLSKQTNTVGRVVAQTCDMGTNVPRFFQAPQIGGALPPPFSCRRADRAGGRGELEGVLERVTAPEAVRGPL